MTIQPRRRGIWLIQRITVAISPRSKTSAPRAWINSRAASQSRAERRHSTAALIVSLSRYQLAAFLSRIGSRSGSSARNRNRRRSRKRWWNRTHRGGYPAGQKHGFALELLQNQLGLRFTGQVTDQIGTHLVQHGNSEK